MQQMSLGWWGSLLVMLLWRWLRNGIERQLVKVMDLLPTIQSELPLQFPKGYSWNQVALVLDYDWFDSALDSCLDEGHCKPLRLYGRAGGGGRLLRKCSRYIVFVELTILLVCGDEANEWTYHFLKCSHTPIICIFLPLLLHVLKLDGWLKSLICNVRL